MAVNEKTVQNKFLTVMIYGTQNYADMKEATNLASFLLENNNLKL